jgi:hypothetical protein
VEVNGSSGDITNTGPFDGVDLPSLITHETGHFLGLDHARTVRSAVMYPSYSAMEDNLRVLHSDDIAGICAIYPPDRKPAIASCGPRGGFSSTCDPPVPSDEGCAMRARNSNRSSSTSVLLAFVAIALLRRRPRG